MRYDVGLNIATGVSSTGAWPCVWRARSMRPAALRPAVGVPCPPRTAWPASLRRAAEPSRQTMCLVRQRGPERTAAGREAPVAPVEIVAVRARRRRRREARRARTRWSRTWRRPVQRQGLGRLLAAVGGRSTVQMRAPGEAARRRPMRESSRGSGGVGRGAICSAMLQPRLASAIPPRWTGAQPSARAGAQPRSCAVGLFASQPAAICSGGRRRGRGQPGRARAELAIGS